MCHTDSEEMREAEAVEYTQLVGQGDPEAKFNWRPTEAPHNLRIKEMRAVVFNSIVRDTEEASIGSYGTSFRQNCYMK